MTVIMVYTDRNNCCAWNNTMEDMTRNRIRTRICISRRICIMYVQEEKYRDIIKYVGDGDSKGSEPRRRTINARRHSKT